MSVLDRFRLDGKRLLITGGSRGLGREMTLAIAEAGADVVLIGRTPESLEQTASDVRSLGRQAGVILGDVGRPDECERVCAQALETGPFDILINNVGGRRINVPVEEQTLAQWQEILDLNLTSTFLCTRIIGGHMKQAGVRGSIINIASISGMVANRNIGGVSYETSKAAVIQFTRTVAVQWAETGIRVNSICPGGFMTEPNQRWAREHPQVVEKFAEQIPVGTYGDPKDLGPLAVFLASDASRYMTGAAVVIDGGYTLV
jgi:NAD(P)-dependent dehydrogenase (short-subunit alcohol dehydrogenase family)